MIALTALPATATAANAATYAGSDIVKLVYDPVGGAGGATIHTATGTQHVNAATAQVVRDKIASQAVQYARSSPPPITGTPATSAELTAANTATNAEGQAARRGFMQVARRGLLRGAFRAIGSLTAPIPALAATNAYLWYKLAQDREWLSGDPPSHGEYVVPATQFTMIPVSAGDTLATVSDGSTGQPCSQAAPCSINAPTDGFKLRFDNNSFYEYRRTVLNKGQGGCDSNAWDVTGNPPTTGLISVVSRFNGCLMEYRAYFRPSALRPKTGTDNGPDAGYADSYPADRTEAQIKQSVSDFMGDELLSPDEKSALAWGLNAAGVDKPPATSTVPNCVGQTGQGCASLLGLASLTATPTVLTFQTADITKGAGVVIRQSPAAGSTAARNSAVTYDVNPDDANMPRLVPAVGAHETYDAYNARLQALGLIGSRADLAPDFLDANRGANEAVSTLPASGTKAKPGDTVTVKTNPADVPATASEPAPTVHAINLAPLMVSTPCNKFPFGVPCWIAGSLTAVSSTGQCPHFTHGLPFGQTLDVDGCMFDPAVAIYKPVMLWASFIALAWLLFNVAMGRSGNDD